MTTQEFKLHLRESILENIKDLTFEDTLITYFINCGYKRGDITEAFSELSQDGKIMRLEYMLPKETKISYIYFPFGTIIR